MHLFTLGFLAILFPRMMFGLVQEVKSWADFESAMGKSGLYALVLVDDSSKDLATAFLDVDCVNYPKVKCYYGMEGNSTQPETSFNQHFKTNVAPAFFFFKDGKEVSSIIKKRPVLGPEVDYIFECVLSVSDHCMYSKPN
ncbi:uncharacterized protein LOC120353176 [Nilaparvata lugens]|uniref:uncharacterized protein LOC120353176 n=1 Tax=Nilaparvata lugens TaxID=108931 RepID=UPI00193EB99F|nr:uncharacterized protein LOC120353176 [Nilaparvata lugens]